MPMLCLAGTFRIVGSEPDGDSIRFYPDDPARWSLVPGPPAVHTNASGGAQLRLDGIDALETHYAPPGSGPLHQPLTFAHRAAGELLRWLGFRSVTRDGEKVVEVADDARPGFILTRGADRNGRCVALVGRGEPPAKDATDVHVNVALLRKTANHRLIATGLAYPTFYLKLYPDLRTELVRQAQKARPRTGLWADDLTQSQPATTPALTTWSRSAARRSSSPSPPRTSSSKKPDPGTHHLNALALAGAQGPIATP
jgi:hypothetical protein